MYFGELFEPRHLCPNDSCGCGHRRLEHEHGFCTGAGITGENASTDHTQEFCASKSFEPGWSLPLGEPLSN
jgi:hypothetical protein